MKDWSELSNEDKITAYLLGDLPEEQRQDVETLIEKDARCQELAGELDLTLGLLQESLATPALEQDTLTELEQARIHREMQFSFKRWFLGHQRPIIDVAAALTIFAVGAALFFPLLNASRNKSERAVREKGVAVILNDLEELELEEALDSDKTWGLKKHRLAAPAVPEPLSPDLNEVMAYDYDAAQSREGDELNRELYSKSNVDARFMDVDDAAPIVAGSGVVNERLHREVRPVDKRLTASSSTPRLVAMPSSKAKKYADHSEQQKRKDVSFSFASQLQEESKTQPVAKPVAPRKPAMKRSQPATAFSVKSKSGGREQAETDFGLVEDLGVVRSVKQPVVRPAATTSRVAKNDAWKEKTSYDSEVMPAAPAESYYAPDVVGKKTEKASGLSGGGDGFSSAGERWVENRDENNESLGLGDTSYEFKIAGGERNLSEAKPLGGEDNSGLAQNGNLALQRRQFMGNTVPHNQAAAIVAEPRSAGVEREFPLNETARRKVVAEQRAQSRERTLGQIVAAPPTGPVKAAISDRSELGWYNNTESHEEFRTEAVTAAESENLSSLTESEPADAFARMRPVRVVNKVAPLQDLSTRGGFKRNKEAYLASADDDVILQALGTSESQPQGLASNLDAVGPGLDAKTLAFDVPVAEISLSAANTEKREALGLEKRPSRLSRVLGKDLENVEETLTDPVFAPAAFNPMVDVLQNKLSTFSIDVDTAAYTIARKYILEHKRPPSEAVRTEEFINYFNYHYTPPKQGAFSVSSEAHASPWGMGHLLKVAIKGRHLGREEERPAVLTLAIDTSGSMETPDRLGLIQKSIALLVSELDAADRVSIVQYGSQANLVLDGVAASEKTRILDAVNTLQISGSTHMEAGIQLAYETAARHLSPDAENRVLILSDGMANLGSDDAGALVSSVAAYRNQGIYCSVFGFGLGTYNDVMLETLADKGNGTYQFIDSEDQAKKVFVDELAATLNIIASDVKIQVEFNEDAVLRYRQLGYENRQLTAKQFRDNTVDAGEVGSGQSVTALYQVELKPGRRKDLGMVRVRYRDAQSGNIVELSESLSPASDSDVPSPHYKVAVGAAQFAEILRGSPYAEGSSHDEVLKYLWPVIQDLDLDVKLRELVSLIQQVKSLPAHTD